MSEVKFYLKTPKNKKDKSLIYLYFSFNGNRLKYSTQETIMPAQWNDKSQKARSNNNLNDFLKKLSNDVERIERELRTSGVKVTTQLLREKLDVELERKKVKTFTFLTFIEDFILLSEKVKKMGTIKGYRNTLTHLKDYKNFKKTLLNFDDINQEFYNDFVNFLTYEKQFRQNTIGKQIKNVKVFMNEAFDAGFNKNQEFKRKKFKVITEEVDTIYLSESELEQLFNFDLSTNSKLEKVRDLFIVGCYTGLRFSDFSSIKSENIDLKKRIISVKTIKMNNATIVPIHKFVIQILKKYNSNENSLPRAVSNQKMNEYLKEIGKLVGLTENIEITYIKENKRVAEVYPKYELISTHTARRSFATNLYLKGFPTISIMSITGHKTERAFLRYIKVTPEQHATMLQKFWDQ